jgi:putative (di)nucleoside polyphosphate hydrolase
MKTTSCGVLVFDAQAELLLCHATGTARWDIPKGMGDPGESPIQTAIRETREETGLEFEEGDLLDLGHLAYRPAKDLHLYAALIDRIDPGRLACSSRFVDARGRTLPEMDAFAWTPFDDVPQRCAKNMIKLLTQTISLPDVLRRLQAAALKPAGPLP